MLEEQLARGQEAHAARGRAKSGAPSSSSSARMWRLSGGCATWSRSRGASDVALFGDGDEVPDLREAHAPYPDRRASRRTREPRSKRYWTRAAGAERSDAAWRSRSTTRARSRGFAQPRRAAAGTLALVGARLRAGITTAEIDRWVREDTARRGGTPSQLGYHGFPAAVCTSRNEVVCHGIPRTRERARDGDIVNVDVTTVPRRLPRRHVGDVRRRRGRRAREARTSSTSRGAAATRASPSCATARGSATSAPPSRSSRGAKAAPSCASSAATASAARCTRSRTSLTRERAAAGIAPARAGWRSPSSR